MNCPLCDTPLDDQGICPNCGEDAPKTTKLPGIYYENLEVTTLEDSHPQKRREAFFTVGEKRAITGCVLILILFIGMIYLVSGAYDPDAAAISGRHGITMDNRIFAIYYETALNQYTSEAESLLFDPNSPLDKQYYNLDVGYTWEDYFMNQALSAAALTESLCYSAQQAGFALSPEELSSLEAEKAAMEDSASASYGNPDRYVAATFGENVTWDVYWQYRMDSALAQAYADACFQSYTFTDEELSAYYDNNSANYSTTPKSDLPNVDIRHILIVPESETPEEDAKAKENAEAALQQCHSGGEAHVEEIFLNLVGEYSQDAGSNANGGLLENLAPGQLSTAISDWCFDSAGRSPGDTAVLPSTYGYHVVYFVGYRDNYQWKDTVLSDMRTQALSLELSALLDETDCALTRFAAIN